MDYDLFGANKDGVVKNYVLTTDEEEVNVGDTVTLSNSNSQFEFDNVTGNFANNLLYYFIVDLKILESDLSDYEVSKSNNGRKYAFAEAEVLKVHRKDY